MRRQAVLPSGLTPHPGFVGNRRTQLDRNFADTHGGLAVVKVQQGLREDARACVGRALRLDPENIPAKYATALLAGRIKDAADLRGFIEKILG